MKSTSAIILLWLFLNLTAIPCYSSEYSKLWGKRGELWSPTSRLPDVSWAGYHHGEKEIPDVPVTAKVTDYGAVPNDGEDDSAAFIQAIEDTVEGAVFIPDGKYIITEIIDISKSNIVLRGESRNGVILYFPKPLQEIRPNWGATTGGRKTSNYAWSGGFLWAKGNYGSKELSKITKPAKRGDEWITLSSTEGLKAGQWVDVRQQDTSENSLAVHLYTGDPGKTEKLRGRTRTSLTARIFEIDGNRIRLERPLRSDIRDEWQPAVHAFNPSVSEVGIENLTFEYPVKPYEGHFTELGMNPVAFSDVAHSWVRNIRVQHADSGLFMSGRFCTVEGVLFESNRPGDSRGDTGHHGIYISDDDNLYTDFDYRTTFIHDISVSHCAGNVISNGKGENLSFDHHKRVPYANVFTNIVVGKGTNIWRCGGGAALGKHCAAWGTFWNIRSDEPVEYPRENFGPWSMNLVGLHTKQESITKEDSKWFETVPPEELVPQNIHKAQLKRRVRKGK